VQTRNYKKVLLGRSGDRKRYSLDAFMGPVLMSEDGATWSDIKPRLVPDGIGFRVDGAPYECFIDAQGGRQVYPERGVRGKYLKLPPTGLTRLYNKQLVSTPTMLDGELLNNRMVMLTPFGNMSYVLTNSGVKLQVLFQRHPTQCELAGLNDRILFDADSTYDIPSMLKAQEGNRIPRPRLIDSSPEPITRWLDWSYKNGQLELGLDFSGLTFPVLLKNTTFEGGTAASADDAYVWELTHTPIINQTYSATSSSSSAASRYWAGMRWVVSITQSQTIGVAWVKIELYDTSYDDANFDIHFEKVAAPAQFTTASGNIENRTRTTNSVSWVANSLGAGVHQSDSLVTPLQEVIDDFSATAIVVIFKPKTDVAKTIRAYAWDYDDNAHGAILHVEYSAGSTAYDESASVIIGNKVTASRLYGGDRDSSVLIGTLVSATRAYAAARASSVLLGVKTTASRVLGSIRASSVLVGVLVSASKSWGMARTASVIIGNKVTASKVYGAIRSASVLLGVKTTATRLLTNIRASSVLIGNKVSATRAITTTRASALSVGVLVSASHIWGVVKSASVLIGNLVSATRAITTARTSSVLVGVKVSASRALTTTRASSVLIGVKVTASKIYGAIKIATVLIGVKVSATRAISISRASSVLVGVKTTATRAITTTRASSVIVGVKVSASHVWGVVKSASVLVGVKVSADRVLSSIRSSSVSIGAKVSASRTLSLTRASSVIVGVVVTAIRALTRQALFIYTALRKHFAITTSVAGALTIRSTVAQSLSIESSISQALTIKPSISQGLTIDTSLQER